MVFADKSLHVRTTLFVKNVARGVQLRVSSGFYGHPSKITIKKYETFYVQIYYVTEKSVNLRKKS